MAGTNFIEHALSVWYGGPNRTAKAFCAYFVIPPHPMRIRRSVICERCLDIERCISVQKQVGRTLHDTSETVTSRLAKLKDTFRPVAKRHRNKPVRQKTFTDPPRPREHPIQLIPFVTQGDIRPAIIALMKRSTPFKGSVQMSHALWSLGFKVGIEHVRQALNELRKMECITYSKMAWRIVPAPVVLQVVIHRHKCVDPIDGGSGLG